MTDLGTSNLADPVTLADWRDVTTDPEYPARVMVAVSNAFGGPSDPVTMAELGVQLKGQQTAKLRHGIVKLVLDGSIQGFSARVSWPHYFDAVAHPARIDGGPGDDLSRGRSHGSLSLQR